MRHATANHMVYVDGTWHVADRRVVRPFDLAPQAPADGPDAVNCVPS